MPHDKQITATERSAIHSSIINPSYHVNRLTSVQLSGIEPGELLDIYDFSFFIDVRRLTSVTTDGK